MTDQEIVSLLDRLTAMLRTRDDRPQEKWLGDGIAAPVGVNELINAFLSLLDERDALKVDAERFRKLENDGVLHDIAPVIRWQTVMRFEPAKPTPLLNDPWTYETKAVYVDQPIREIKLRWVDENNDQPTLLHMIDAALQAEKETRS